MPDSSGKYILPTLLHVSKMFKSPSDILTAGKGVLCPFFFASLFPLPGVGPSEANLQLPSRLGTEASSGPTEGLVVTHFLPWMPSNQ